MTPRGTPRDAILLALILIAGTAGRLWGIGFGLPNTTVHPDEGAIVGIAGGMLFAGLNPHFFHWPSFEFYVVAACYRIWWQVQHWRGLFQHKWEIQNVIATDPSTFILIPRLLSVAAGVATIWCVYRLARQVLDRTTALVAAFFLAVAFLHLRDSHFGVTDVPMTFLAMAAMLPLARALASPASMRHWTMAGVLTGLAASTKYNGGLMAAAGAGVAAIVWMDARRTDGVRSTAIQGLCLFGVASLLAFIVGTPYAVLDAPAFVGGLGDDGFHLMAGHGELMGRGWIYHALFSLRYGVGAPMLIAAAAGMVLLARRSRRTVVLLCTFPIVYYVFVGRGYTVFVRYVTPIVPFLCLTAAIAVVAVSRWMVRHRPAAMPLATAALTVLVALPSIRLSLDFDALAGQDDTRLVAAAWVDAHRQAGDWINEESPALLHPGWGRPAGILVSHFDTARGAFLSDAGDVVTPEWVALGSSALVVYPEIESKIQPRLAGAYELVTTIAATSAPESAAIFDRQDHFYFPYTDFSRRLRSGPDIRIYRRIHGR